MLEVRLDRLQSRARKLLRPGVIATFPWGRGSGKTYFGRSTIHEWCLENGGTHVGLLMPTLKQARAVFWPGLLQDYYGPLRAHLRTKPNLTELVCEYANGSRLTTWGAENANSIRGQRFDRLVQDESDDIDPDVENAIVEPTFSKSGSRAIWLKTGTPKRGRYGSLYLGYRQGQDGTPERKRLIEAGVEPRGYVSLRFRSEQSPQVDRVWLENVRRKLIASGRKTTYQREYCCEFDSADGLVYSHFEDGLHVRMPPPDIQWTEILVGIDHGFRDPQVKLTIGVIGHGKDAILWIIDEWYETEQSNTQLIAAAKAIKARWYERAPMHWYADPSRPDTIKLYQNEGIPIEEAKNSIEDGVAAVADRTVPNEVELPDGSKIRVARLYVSPHCVNTLREFGSYRRKRDPKDAENVLDDIEDKNNHAMDAARYAIYTRFGYPGSSRHDYDPYGQHVQDAYA